MTMIMSTAERPEAWQRLPCTSCQRSYKFYCPKCNIPVGVPDDVDVPSLTLPLQVHVWFQDKIKKSTAPHAKVLAPRDVEILPYPLLKDRADLLQYTHENAVVVYPSYAAETLDEMSTEELRAIRTLIFIDCPWQKAPVIMTDNSIAHLRHVKLARPPQESNFWRYHKAGAGCVSTIEGMRAHNSCVKLYQNSSSPCVKNLAFDAAIHLMLEEYTAAAKKRSVSLREGSETTHLSDLLFFFKLQFTRIVEHCENETDLERKPPMDADEKERRRLMYSQKEQGKKRRLENKLQAWNARSLAIQSGKGPPATTQSKRHCRCFNCKKDDHHSKDCPQPCRYCKQLGHFSADCSMKQAAHEREMKFQQTPRTRAL